MLYGHTYITTLITMKRFQISDKGRTGKSEKQVGDEASLLSVKTTTAYLNALSQTTGPRGETEGNRATRVLKAKAY